MSQAAWNDLNERDELDAAPQSALNRTSAVSHLSPPHAEDRDPKIGSALAGGKLVIEELIGCGGVGDVYKARHRELMMPVAVKVLRDSLENELDFRRQFHAEALAISRLDHPNVTRIIDFGQDADGQFYLAMEFLDGVEVRALIEKERKLPAARITAVMMQVCAGLSHAHSRGIVHRDVKPENLVLIPALDDDGQPVEIVKICDFGIAQHQGGAADFTRLPRPRASVAPCCSAAPSLREGFGLEFGVIVGTPEYMSPEQCRCDVLDGRSDVYSCGVIMYELATGQLPFTADEPMKLLNEHQFTIPAPPSELAPEVDPSLEAIILKALAKDPNDRYASMRELRAALRTLSSRASEAPATPSIPPATTSSTEAHDALAQHASAWTTQLAQTTEPQEFAHRAQSLENTVRTLAEQGEVNALWQIASTMHGIAAEEGAANVGSRAWIATDFLRVFDDPGVIVPVAERMLVGPCDVREKARRVLMYSGASGARGLHIARMKHAHLPAVRPLFVTAMKDFGSLAWPLVKASLEKIVTTNQPTAFTSELAEDLLACVPSGSGVSAAHLVLEFLRWPTSGVYRAASTALLELWGFSAKPVQATRLAF